MSHQRRVFGRFGQFQPFQTRLKWHDMSGDRPRCTSRRFLWVDIKSNELARAILHLFDAFKGDLMRALKNENWRMFPLFLQSGVAGTNVLMFSSSSWDHIR